MLTELRIRNFAIIESLTLPLARGFNVLTGETGAGKSIIVGALGLLLGERASADLIRTGADRAAVEGAFDVSDRPEITALLDERGIEVEDGLVVLKREIAAGGRARAWVNGSSTSATTLADIGRLLVNLHGQHEAQTLLDGDSQRRILDAFAGAHDIAAAVATTHAELADVRREIADLQRRRADAERRADYLRHVVNEIEEAKLLEGEDVRLEDEARRLENADELRSLAGGLVAALDGEEESVLERLGAIERQLHAIQRVDPSLQRLQEVYDTAYYGLQSLARELDEYHATVDLDPERLDQVRTRRDLIFRLTKKHGPSLQDVIETGRRARAELDLVDSAGMDLTHLADRERDLGERLRARASELTERRQEAAAELARAVDGVLPELGMPDGRFSAMLVPLEQVGTHGAEHVEFRITLNRGHESRPLSRVASGGELSRVMLALKTILARLDHVPTLVFDEVDAGIGGRVGLQVGDTMRRVAADHQVFAITHLPQIAARAHHHIVVQKDASGGVTTTGVTVVDADERVTEIARMLGGDPESDVSRAHARELLDSASAAAVSAPPAGVSSRSGRATRRATS